MEDTLLTHWRLQSHFGDNTLGTTVVESNIGTYKIMLICSRDKNEGLNLSGEGGKRGPCYICDPGFELLLLGGSGREHVGRR